MKEQIKKWIAVAVFSFFTNYNFAQDSNSTQEYETPVPAPWVSDKGYWVTESNVQTPTNHIIRFYTNEDILVYTEKLNGVKLNINKRKVKMKLKKALEISLLAWEQHKQPLTDKDYVIALLR